VHEDVLRLYVGVDKVMAVEIFQATGNVANLAEIFS
jgi:predicted RNA-binding protein